MAAVNQEVNNAECVGKVLAERTGQAGKMPAVQRRCGVVALKRVREGGGISDFIFKI